MTPTRPRTEPIEPAPHRWAALAVLSLGVFMGTLDVSIVNVALPTMTRQLKTDLATIQWVIVSYGLIVTSFMLSVGRLGDLIGKRRIYSWGIVLFGAGSLLAGLSDRVWLLLAARAIQACGAVMMQALSPAMVSEIFPAREMGRALGLVGAAVSVGLAAGPAIGGLLIAAAGWKTIFLINVPIAVLALIGVRRWVPPLRPVKATGRFDVLGSLLMLIGLGGYALAMTMLHDRGSGRIAAWALAALAVIGLVAFWRRQRTGPAPMVDLNRFTDPRLWWRLLIGFLVFIALAGNYVLPFFLQYAQKYSIVQVGLLMMLLPVTMGLVAPLAGWWADRFGDRWAITLGLAVATVGLWLVSTLQPQSGWWEFIWKASFIGLGVGLFQSPNLREVMALAPADHRGVASGLTSLSRTMGTITGMPVVTMIFSYFMGEGSGGVGRAVLAQTRPEALAGAMSSAFRFTACVALAALAIFWLRVARAGRRAD